jgi:Imidazolonepropionase and related amidohydrolases
LLSATKNSSHLLGIDDKYGSLETGKIADFLVLDDDPIADIKAVQQTDKAVYKKGVKVF